jgi:hypothetical protein
MNFPASYGERRDLLRALDQGKAMDDQDTVSAAILDAP